MSPPVIYQEYPDRERARASGSRASTVKGFDIVIGPAALDVLYQGATGRSQPREDVAPRQRGHRGEPEHLGHVHRRRATRSRLHSGRATDGNGNNDYWAGGNPGNTLYSHSVVALDAMTGKMKWFQQLLHHDIWDYDLAAAPVLIDVRRNGQVIPALAQTTKFG